MATPPRSRILAPVRYSAWLAGDLGEDLRHTLESCLQSVPDVQVTKLSRGFLVEANESPGPLLECVAQGMLAIDHECSNCYPVFHQEMGPVWTGTLQAVFVEAQA